MQTSKMLIKALYPDVVAKEVIGELLVCEIVVDGLGGDGVRIKVLKNPACINNMSHAMLATAFHLVLIHVEAHSCGVQHEAGFTRKARQRVGFMVA